MWWHSPRRLAAAGQTQLMPTEQERQVEPGILIAVEERTSRSDCFAYFEMVCRYYKRCSINNYLTNVVFIAFEYLLFVSINIVRVEQLIYDTVFYVTSV